MMQKTISIISDWQNEDFYLSLLKARLKQSVSGYQVMDISHRITAFDNMQAAFVLRAVWEEFPEGSIHLNCVNAASGKETPHVLIKHKNQYFIGADLGYWSFILKEKPEKAYLINDEMFYEGASFPEISVFSKVAAAISKGLDVEEMGGEAIELKGLIELNPEFDSNRIFAPIVYFDSYGNAIVNLTKDDFQKHVLTDNFRISLQSERNQTKRIVKSYLSVKQGELLAMFNSQNLLEIAIREGNIRQLLNLDLGTQVRIDF